MTGYAARDVASDGVMRSWELRSVNGRGLDLRLRLPERLGRLDILLRDRLKKALARGSVTLSLKITREDSVAVVDVNDEALRSHLAALAHVQRTAEAQGLPVGAPDATRILTLPGVMAASGDLDLPSDEVLLAEFDALLTAFLASRAEEGRALSQTLKGQIDAMAPLVTRAADLAEARKGTAAERLRETLQKILDTAQGMDPDRLAEALAVQAVKSDVTEEIDRLANAHIPAARALLTADGPVGRRFDFLMQEFNREANTLCSKSSDAALTQTGLDLKVAIDQMREQVQNVE
ncbi:YicC/YloC family endoribonuclease [Nioella nitratireducens]|uniref:YicC/YloC family endoribonuclease n=1 Tax=Nioella nitratireducens TaxID=1287720 RepID=UPI0008FCF2D1|nr:YicC/YloC family endoribonuclease [Nioella nitratireducens]